MDKEEKKISYLQLLQEPIGRMSATSAIFKGFSAAILAGLATATMSDINIWALVLGLIPIISFASLDLFYLSIERKLKYRYRQVIDEMIVLDYKINGELVCKLTVRTTYRIDGTDFYIYCKDLKGDNDCAFYLENGTTFDLMMPLGEYSVYYCTGRTWYGSEELFGVETICCKMDDTLNFTKETTDNSIYYKGWEITLQTVEGNQVPEYINKSDFPR